MTVNTTNKFSRLINQAPIFVVCALVASGCPRVEAADFESNFSLPLTLDFDTNPTMASNNRSAVWKYGSSPRINLQLADGINQWSTDGTLRVVRSSDKNLVIDREDPVINMKWQRELERGSISVLGHYDEMSTRDTQLDDTGDVVVKETTRSYRSLGVKWSRIMTERLTLSLGGNYTDTRYSKSTQVNQTNQSLNASLGYAWTEFLRPSVQFGVSHQMPDRGAASKLYTTGLGLDWDVSERMSVNLHGGLRKIVSETSGGGVTTQTGASGMGWNADSSVKYALERSTYTLNLSRSTEPSGTGGFKEKDQIKGSAIYDISDISRFGVDLSLRRVFSGNPTGGSQNSNENSLVSVWVTRALSKTWNAKFQVQTKDTKNSGVESRGNILGISLTYATEK